jgi:hypothetical protein
LLLELPQRGGVHHGAAGLELMDMDIDQARLLIEMIKPHGNRPT